MELFLGFFLILMDIPVTVGTAVIDVLPDMIGYYLVLKALEKRADAWRHIVFGLMLVSAVLFAADLVDKSAGAALGFGLAALAVESVMLALLYRVICRRARLRMLFPMLACIRLLYLMVAWLPLVGDVCGAVSLVVSACYLLAWKKWK